MGNRSRGLKRRLQSKKPAPHRKLSSRLEKLAQPFLDDFPEWNGSEEYVGAMRELMCAAAVAWNHAVAQDVGNTAQQSAMTLSDLPEEMRRVLDTLVMRKREMFPDDHRVLDKVDVLRSGNCLRIEVTSCGLCKSP